MDKFEFDHLEDLTHMVIEQVHSVLINHLKSIPSKEYCNQWEKLIVEAKKTSSYEFLFKNDFLLTDLAKEAFLKADLNGRKIKKASELYDKEFKATTKKYQITDYDHYDDLDINKAIKYSLFQFHAILIEMW